MRHGAYNDSDRAITDEERILTPEGKKQVAVAANALREKGMRPDKIISSPLARARETATIVARILDYAGEIEITNALLFSAGITEMRELIDQNTSAVQLMFVGHMPSMGALAHSLIADAEHANTAMGKSEIIGIELENTKPLHGSFLWRITPR